MRFCVRKSVDTSLGLSWGRRGAKRRTHGLLPIQSGQDADQALYQAQSGCQSLRPELGRILRTPTGSEDGSQLAGTAAAAASVESARRSLYRVSSEDHHSDGMA